MSQKALSAIIESLPAEMPTEHRFIIALAGPPTAGKTTLAAELADQLGPRAGVLGLDAFHFDDAILEARGHRARKGAPHTFDVDGYRRALSAVRTEPTATVAVPVFDRNLELSRGSAELITEQPTIVITEGNYLLLDESPWRDLESLFDRTVSLSIDLDTVTERTMQRWDQHGFTVAQAQARLRDNDEPNARLVLEQSRPGHIQLVNGEPI